MKKAILTVLLALSLVSMTACGPRMFRAAMGAAIIGAVIVGTAHAMQYHDDHYHYVHCGHEHRWHDNRRVYYYGGHWEYYDRRSGRWYVYADDRGYYED